MNPLGNGLTDQAPADPAATDDMLASQPVGYGPAVRLTGVPPELSFAGAARWPGCAHPFRPAERLPTTRR